VLLGNANGTFQSAVKLSVGGGGVSITTADFNGDGKPNLAVENFLREPFRFWLNLGNGGIRWARGLSGGGLVRNCREWNFTVMARPIWSRAILVKACRCC